MKGSKKRQSEAVSRTVTAGENRKEDEDSQEMRRKQKMGEKER